MEFKMEDDVKYNFKIPANSTIELLYKIQKKWIVEVSHLIEYAPNFSSSHRDVE